MGGMQPRTVALIGLLGLGLGWAVGGRAPLVGPGEGGSGRASGGPRPLGVPPNAAYAPPEPLKVPRRSESARVSGPPPTARNPFAFGERRETARVTPRTEAAETGRTEGRVDEPRAPELPPAPVLRLTGMATAQGPDGPEYTAMVHDGRSLLFLKRGDRVLDFVVVDIRDTAVTLRDAAGDGRRSPYPRVGKLTEFLMTPLFR
jgi:hypothetical protein